MAAVRQDIETSLGTIPVWTHAGPPGRPLLLAIRGVFPPADHLDWLADVFPELDVALVHLPGMHSPYMPEGSIERFAAAFDEVLHTLGHERVVVVGLSMGGLAAMSLKSPALRAILLVDTPLDTTSLWPMHGYFVTHARNDPLLQDWFVRICGVVPGGIVKLDYGYLLAGLRTPVGLLAGGLPLGEPRPISKIPSLVSEADLAAYRARSWVSVLMAPNAGHYVVAEAPDAFLGALRRLRTVALSS